MSIPITILKPTLDRSTFRGPGMVTTYTVKSKQPKPHDEPAPYYRCRTTMTSGRTTGMTVNSPKNGYPSWMETSDGAAAPMAVVCWPLFKQKSVIDAQKAAVSRARGELKDALGERAEWLVNFTQQKQALKMMSTRLDQLNRAATGTLRYARHPIKGAKALASLIASFPRGLRDKGRFATVTRQWRNRSADAGALWLELHFGWEQLTNDVYAAACIYTDPPPNGRVRVRSAWINATWSNSLKLPYESYSEGNFKIRTRASITCHAEIINLNGFRQASLGLANPATVVWDLIPFSFVVDWFANVSAYLAQPTDFLGVKFTKPSHAILTRITGTGRAAQGGPNRPGEASATSMGYEFQRIRGIPGVDLVAYPLKYPSPTRGLTAIALLLTTFRSPAWHY